MRPAIFLSASVPQLCEGKSKPDIYFETADRIAIRDAVRALVTIACPVARIIWGGHPAITPLVRVIAEDMGYTDGERFRLFQSHFFDGRMPEDNAAFEHVVKTKSTGELDSSILLMRNEMLQSEKFAAGVFIGGMKGVEDEFEIFRGFHPMAPALPVASTGAAALRLFEMGKDFPTDLKMDLAYPSLFRKHLAFLRA